MSDEVSNKSKSAVQETDLFVGHTFWQRIVVRHSSVWRPPTDVYEQEDRLVILIEIAGMKDRDFRIVLQDRHLIVSGMRRQVIEPQAVAYHQMEIARGEFRTYVYLPWKVQREQAVATYRDGLLRIELPKTQEQHVHTINISTGK